MTDLHDPIFTNETKAREYLEAIRWPEGPVCPHCGVLEKASKVKGGREGLYFCNACREQFTVTVGTVLRALQGRAHQVAAGDHLLSSSKKGMSAHQLHRMLGVTYKTAWFMATASARPWATPNPNRWAAKARSSRPTKPISARRQRAHATTRVGRCKRGRQQEEGVVTLVERGGTARSFHVPSSSPARSSAIILVTNVDRKSVLMTDEARSTGRRPRVRPPRHRQSREAANTSKRRRPHQHRRRLLLDLQARHDWHLSALRRAASAPLSQRVRFPLSTPARSATKSAPRSVKGAEGKRPCIGGLVSALKKRRIGRSEFRRLKGLEIALLRILRISD